MTTERAVFKIRFTQDGKLEIDSPKLKEALQRLRGTSQDSLSGELRITQPLSVVKEDTLCSGPDPLPPLIICFCDEAFLLDLKRGS